MKNGAASVGGLRGDVLRFGLPSKGRLQGQVAEFLGERGIDFVKSRVDREYAGGFKGVDDVEVIFLPAGEMPQKLTRGEIHLGVTGEDLVRERGGAGLDGEPDRIEMLAPLGFGRADLVVAVPKFWMDVDTTADFDDVAADFRDRHGRPLRIATKYPRLSRRFFRDRGVANYRLIDSQGATEGLVAAHAAEAIVDITSSGETLRANHLKVLTDGLILKSEAHLCASLSAPWGAGAVAALERFLRLVARPDGRRGQTPSVRITADIDASALRRAEAALARIDAALERAPEDGTIGRAVLRASTPRAGLALDVLLAAGATHIAAEELPAADAERTPAPGAPDARASRIEAFLAKIGSARG